MLYIHETFLVHKLETFKNCKEVKYIMIISIATIYIFLSCVTFHQQMKITFRKFLAPPPPLSIKIHYPLFTHSPPPKSYSPFYKNPLPSFYSPSPPPLKVTPLFPNIEKFSGPLQKKGWWGWEDTEITKIIC